MLADIARQPDVLRGLVARLDEINAFRSAHLVPGTGGRIVAFGSGDGWFAARSAAAEGITPATGLEVLGGVGPTLGPADRAIAISMSGNVDRTVEAAEVALEACGGTASLTNSDGGRLADLGLPNLSLDLPDIAKFLCGTSSFIATRAVLAAIGRLSRGETISSIADRLTATADALEFLLPEAESLAQEVAAEGGNAKGLRFLSCGTPMMAVADYGAAKIVELSGTPVWSDDIEEFAHRQFWTMQRGEVAVIMPPNGPVARIGAESAKALQAMNVQTFSLAPRSLEAGGTWRLDWPDDDRVDHLTMATVGLQYFGYYWSRATGYDPDRRMHLKEDTERFKTSRMLTRRSLLALAGDARTAI